MRILPKLFVDQRVTALPIHWMNCLKIHLPQERLRKQDYSRQKVMMNRTDWRNSSE